MIRQRTGAPADLLVVGLGNPGPQYAGTRHNLGATTVEVLAARHGGRLSKSRQQALVSELRVDSHRVVLAFPQTFMNESGRAVAALIRRHGIDELSRVVVVHDELDLPAGRLKVKVGGGFAGHKGLRSIAEHLHDDGFVRVRVGVGKPGADRSGADHVLRRPGRAEQVLLDEAVERAADAVEVIACQGVDVAMARFNAPTPS